MVFKPWSIRPETFYQLLEKARAPSKGGIRLKRSGLCHLMAEDERRDNERARLNLARF
jgi:hypothetical protein